MTISILHRLERIVLMFSIFFLPILGLPKRISFVFLSCPPSEFFILLGMGLLIVEWIRFGLDIPKKVNYFIIIFTLWQLLCAAIGTICYQYQNLIIFTEPSRSMMLLSKLGSLGLPMSGEIAENLWLFIRSTKTIIFHSNLIFYGALLVYHLYHSDYQMGFRDFRRAILAMVIVMGSYSFVELIWIKTDSVWARNILECINPYLYDIKTSHGWYPPLLWKGQVRSITSEPSFFGIVSVFFLPFLWSFLYEKKYVSVLLIFYFTFMIFATNARTAIVVSLGELFLLTVSILFVRRRKYTKYVVIILVISGCSFLGNLVDFRAIGLFFPRSATVTMKDTLENQAQSYYSQNIHSLKDKNARSNGARFASIVANLETIKQHPVFGVGTGLTDGYIDANIPEFAYNNPEVRNWSRYLHIFGINNCVFPPLNKYCYEAVKNGIVGLGIFLVPFAYWVIKIFDFKRKYLQNPCYIFPSIALFGQFACWMSNEILTIISGLLLGLLLCNMISLSDGKKE